MSLLKSSSIFLNILFLKIYYIWFWLFFFPDLSRELLNFSVSVKCTTFLKNAIYVQTRSNSAGNCVLISFIQTVSVW